MIKPITRQELISALNKEIGLLKMNCANLFKGVLNQITNALGLFRDLMELQG
jgi:nucleoid DNA-binding protein